MVHAGHEEEAVVVVDVHRGVRERELVHALVVVQGVPGADQLVCPADVLKQFALVRRPRKGSEVGVDGLTSDARSAAGGYGETPAGVELTLACPGSISSDSWRTVAL